MTLVPTASPAATRVPRLTAAVLACLALAACAPAPAAPETTLEGPWPRARAALDAATSVRVTGRWHAEAPTAGDTVVSVAGPLAEGAYRGTSSGPEGSVEAVIASGTAYVRRAEPTGGPSARPATSSTGASATASASPSASVTASASAAAGPQGSVLARVPEGRWLALPDEAAGLVSPAALVDGLREALPAADAFSGGGPVAEEVTVDGVALHRFADVPVAGGRVDLYLDGQDRLARVEHTGDGEGPAGQADVVVFADWDAVPPVSAPPSGEVFARPGL